MLILEVANRNTQLVLIASFFLLGSRTKISANSSFVRVADLGEFQTLQVWLLRRSGGDFKGKLALHIMLVHFEWFEVVRASIFTLGHFLA